MPQTGVLFKQGKHLAPLCLLCLGLLGEGKKQAELRCFPDQPNVTTQVSAAGGLP